LPALSKTWQAAGAMLTVIGLPGSTCGLPSNSEMKPSPDGCV
jgi:hypothetical protein